MGDSSLNEVQPVTSSSMFRTDCEESLEPKHKEKVGSMKGFTFTGNNIMSTLYAM